MNQKVSDAGALEICEHEGIVPAPYYDSANVLTWGIGHTRNAGGLDPAKMPRGMPDDVDAAIDQAIRVFVQDLRKYEARVARAIKVPLEAHQFDALVSFDLNTGGIFKAILTRAINRGDPDASRHFFGWLRPPELRKRRTAEKRLFENGNYDQNGDEITVWNVNSQGKITGVHSVIRGRDLLKRMRQLEGEDRQPPATLGLFDTILAILKGFT